MVRKMDQDNNSTSSILRILADIEQQGIGLLCQQMWCWGQDIKHEEGNLLLSYGFTCKRPPEGEKGSTAYLLKPRDQESLMLWGFGLCYARSQMGGMFLKRDCFTPRWMPNSDVLTSTWNRAKFPETSLPQTPEEGRIACTLLASALYWMSSYEQWILSTLGLEYRQSCLEKLRQPFLPPDEYRQHCLEKWGQPFLPPKKAVAEWERLAKLCEDLLPHETMSSVP